MKVSDEQAATAIEYLAHIILCEDPQDREKWLKHALGALGLDLKEATP